MGENIIMPKLGMTMKEGTVEEWFKSEGDTCLLYTSPSPRD